MPYVFLTGRESMLIFNMICALWPLIIFSDLTEQKTVAQRKGDFFNIRRFP